MEKIKTPKLTFENRIKVADIKTKKYYSEIKNLFLSYGLKSRMTNNKESFRKKGHIALIKFGGKKLKVFLAIRPEPFLEEDIKVDVNGNLSDFERYPTLIKITSKRKLETLKLVFECLMLDRGFNLKRGYEYYDYTKDLIPSGQDIFTFLKCSNLLVDKIDTNDLSRSLPTNLIDFVPTITKVKEEHIENASIYLDTLSDHFNSNDIINHELLLKHDLVRKGNGLRIRARGVLSKPLTIYAEEFDEDALKMIYATNGKAVKII